MIAGAGYFKIWNGSDAYYLIATNISTKRRSDQKGAIAVLVIVELNLR